MLIALAVLRLLPTYRTFSATADEATHVGAGLEIYQFHQYQLQRINPPGARVVLAIAPALGGMRFDPTGDYGAQLHSVFYGSGRYERNLFLSRIGNTFFVIVAATALFFYVRRRSDELTAVVAAFLFTFEPVILGHSGLATNDAAATAGLAVALLAFTRWFEKPTLLQAAMLGAGWAFAVWCKFSNLAFVPLACLGIGIVRLIHDRDGRANILRRAPALLVIALVTPLALWAGYAFSIGTMGEVAPVASAFGSHVEQFIMEHPSTPLPAAGFFHRLGNIRLIDRVGHNSYFRGSASRMGWPLYFPTTILLKTTLVLLQFIALAVWFTRSMPRLRALALESGAAALLILALSATSRLDLGIRYILPIFVPLTMAAAAGAAAMLRSRRAAKIVAALLLIWHAAASLGAHPDYFPYFNALAGRDPSGILIDSNLDWGQDMLRLRRELRRAHVDRVGLSLMGGGDYDALGFPPSYPLDPRRPSTGWVAVSDHMYRMEAAEFGGWRWLSGAKFTRVGKSIRLYHFSPNAFREWIPEERPALILLPFAGTKEEVVFPMGLRWRIRQAVMNNGSETVRITTNACMRTASCSFDLAAGQTVAIQPPWSRPPYVILRIDPRAAGQLRTSTVVERTDAAANGFKLSIPEVRDEQFGRESLVIPNVPLSTAYRLHLRVWTPDASEVSFTVKIVSGGATIGQRTYRTDRNGYMSEGDLIIHDFHELFGRELAVDVAITLESPDTRFWAFIIATDNRTNFPELRLPARPHN